MNTQTMPLEELFVKIENTFNNLIVAHPEKTEEDQQFSVKVIYRTFWRPLKRDQHAVQAFILYLVLKYNAKLAEDQEAAQEA